ncbi:MAG: response regulator [Steroidobacteraceae bacterium]
MPGSIQSAPLVCVIDDDAAMRGSLDSLLRSNGFAALTFDGPQAYLATPDTDHAACLILDVRLQCADGLEFQQALAESDMHVPVVMITGYGDIPMTVRSMKAGAVDFLAKPFEEQDLLRAVREAVQRDQYRRSQLQADAGLRARYESLTPREREVMALVTAGLMNKQVASRLGVSEITVKIHRGNTMRKMGVRSLADLVHAAEILGVRDSAVQRTHSAD